MYKFYRIIVFQLGTLGAGNHYAEIQVVDEIFDKWAASKMGIEEKGQVCVMIHSGSRGFGHQVATGDFKHFNSSEIIMKITVFFFIQNICRCFGTNGKSNET